MSKKISKGLTTLLSKAFEIKERTLFKNLIKNENEIKKKSIFKIMGIIPLSLKSIVNTAMPIEIINITNPIIKNKYFGIKLFLSIKK